MRNIAPLSRQGHQWPEDSPHADVMGSAVREELHLPLQVSRGW
jgi:hypothetical protein